MKQRLEEMLKLIGVEDSANRSLAAFQLEEIIRDIALGHGVTSEQQPVLVGSGTAAN